MHSSSCIDNCLQTIVQCLDIATGQFIHAAKHGRLGHECNTIVLRYMSSWPVPYILKLPWLHLSTPALDTIKHWIGISHARYTCFIY